MRAGYVTKCYYVAKLSWSPLMKIVVVTIISGFAIQTRSLGNFALYRLLLTHWPRLCAFYTFRAGFLWSSTTRGNPLPSRNINAMTRRLVGPHDEVMTSHDVIIV